jgi:hypothetical protein
MLIPPVYPRCFPAVYSGEAKIKYYKITDDELTTVRQWLDTVRGTGD